MKKKVLHISKYYSPHVGGIEDICKSIVDNMAEFDFEVLCFSDSKDDIIDYVDGIKVIRAGVWKQVARQSIPYHFGKILRNVLKSFNPDIIHLHLPNPLVLIYVLLFVSHDIKIVVHWHSDIIVHENIHTFVLPLEKLILKRATTIIATSMQYIEGSKLLKKFQRKCVIVPNVVSEMKMDAKPKSNITIEQLHNRYGENIVLFVGRHVKYKGLEYLIESSKFLRDDETILIAGYGPETNDLKIMAKGLNNIIFIGRIPDDELGTYMRAAKIFAFPSVSKNEAFGVALAEAMYCGAVPVTFTISGSGVNWVNVNNETGIEVANKDYVAFAKAIDMLIGDEVLRSRYRINAKQRIIDNFTMNKIINKLICIYEK